MTGATDLDELCVSVGRAVETYALPWLEARSTAAGMLAVGPSGLYRSRIQVEDLRLLADAAGDEGLPA